MSEFGVFMIFIVLLYLAVFVTVRAYQFEDTIEILVKLLANIDGTTDDDLGYQKAAVENLRKARRRLNDISVDVRTICHRLDHDVVVPMEGKNIRIRDCGTCCYGGVPVYEDPCKDCVNVTDDGRRTLPNWKPVNRARSNRTVSSCNNCKHSAAPDYEEPCKSCEFNSTSGMTDPTNWEPKED